MTILKLLITAAVIILPVYLQCRCSGRKTDRAHLAALPAAALIVSGVSVFLIVRYFRKVDLPWGNVEFLKNTDLIAANLLILVLFLILKLILRPLLSWIWEKTGLTRVTSPPLYEYDEDYGEWFLRKNWTNFRRITFAVVCGSLLGTVIYLWLTWKLGSGSVVWSMIMPCAALTVIAEIFCYVSGETREEFEHSIFGDNSFSRKVSNFYKLREILEKLFAEPLITSYTTAEFAGRTTPGDLIKDLKESQDKADRITAEYFAVHDRCKNADIDCFRATLDMMHRKNVVFFNPFYRDLTMYITLPLMSSLLAGKKAVVITGRDSEAEDAVRWLDSLISGYTHINTLWRVARLTDQSPACEVGVMSFRQLYSTRLISENREFFHDTDFVMLIEPSAILGTGQVPLSIIAKEMHTFDEKPVYCICDRIVDGLVDTMSHILHAELTEVSAPPIPKCVFTGMSWDADGDFMRQQFFDKQTRYLGNGVELAAVAVKNQIPKVSWFSETRSPLKDIRWIAGQYYLTICKYMNLPAQQEKLYQKLDFVPTLWSSEAVKDSFIIAEDEFCNLFSAMRSYLTRGTSNSFVNILSENYLLRDYMRCNKQMFISEPDAIPSLVPDYAKTERNTLIKLILTMTYRPVTDGEITDELRLVGIETADPIDALSKLMRKYTFIDSNIIKSRKVNVTGADLSPVTSCQHTIERDTFAVEFADSLQTAYFIIEDEKSNSDYIDAKMFSHVTQLILPAQFVTYNGKYYTVRHISPQNGVVLRRAADLYSGRRYYRQIRKYHLEGQGEIMSTRTLIDIGISVVQMDFSADTTGYLDMSDYHDLRTARLVDFTNDPEFTTFTRRYRNKDVLRLELPDTSVKERFTFCLLLTEIFRTLFPDSWQYLAAVTYEPGDVGGMLNYAIYSADGIPEDSCCVYIIEDSDIDFGLIEAIDRNFIRIMEIMADFLEWHLEKMREPAGKDPLPVEAVKRADAVKKKQNMFQKMAERIFRLFGRGRKKEEEPVFDEEAEKKRRSAEEEPDEAPADVPEKEISEEPGFTQPGTDDVPADEEQKEDTSGLFSDAETKHFAEEDFLADGSEDSEIACVDGTDIFENEGMPEDNYLLELQFKALGIIPLTKTRYQEQCYLKYGFEEIDGRIQADELRKYLRVHGFCRNSLNRARKYDARNLARLDLAAENHCDFCGLPLSSVSYEVLNDGRVRCNNCSSSAIETVEELRDIYFGVLELMQSFFNIRYRASIRVQTADARAIAKGYGSIFKPTTGYAARVLGYAQLKGGKYSLIVENGSPRLSTIETMVHEMTHIWQYINWNMSQVEDIYRMNDPYCTKIATDIVYEGMAVWASVQYLYQIGETYFAAQIEQIQRSRYDIYGVGFRLYCEQYPLVKDSSLLGYTPFSQFPPLEPSDVTAAVRSACRNEKCKC